MVTCWSRPLRHVDDPGLLNPEELGDLMAAVNLAVGVLRSQMNAEGFNIGLNLGRVAGAGIEEHMHFHVVPRWNGDHNFMTVLGEVRSIPEHIRATYQKLKPHFADLK